MARETWVQSQVESYQRLKKWYLMPSCLTLSIIRYGSRVKWSNPGKGVTPFPTPWCSRYRKRRLGVTVDYVRQLYFLLMYVSINIMVRVLANVPGDGVQSQVESFQRLNKWYLMPTCLTLSIIRYGSRVK